MTVRILLVIYFLFTCLAFTHNLHVGGDKRITRKYRNPESPQNIRKVLVANNCTIDEMYTPIHTPTTTTVGHNHTGQVIALRFLCVFKESANYTLLSFFCNDSNLHISIFKYILSTMGISKELAGKFLIGNLFHEKLYILSPGN